MRSDLYPSVNGTFYRILIERDLDGLLEGVLNREGRFHHGGQPALYMSPQLDWALKAVEAYRRDGDPPRVSVRLELTNARVADIRDQDLCRKLGVDPADAAVPWLPQLKGGQVPSSWRIADAIRAAGADGMIYSARSSAERWHIVLFRWNVANGPTVSIAGLPRPI